MVCYQSRRTARNEADREGCETSNPISNKVSDDHINDNK